MSNQEKFRTRSSKWKIRRANSQTLSSYHVRFSTDILFSSLVSFDFCLLPFFMVYLKLQIYILIYIWLCGLVSDKKKKKFTWPISGNKTNFLFGLTPKVSTPPEKSEGKYHILIHPYQGYKRNCSIKPSQKRLKNILTNDINTRNLHMQRKTFCFFWENFISRSLWNINVNIKIVLLL